jgi:hypothetical protein
VLVLLFDADAQRRAVRRQTQQFWRGEAIAQAEHRHTGDLDRLGGGEYSDTLDVIVVKLGRQGIAKQICLGFREADASIDYLRAFVAVARTQGDAKR